MSDPIPGSGKYIVQRIQRIEVDTNDWSTLDGQTEWTDQDIIQLAQDNYDWGDPSDVIGVIAGPYLIPPIKTPTRQDTD